MDVLYFINYISKGRRAWLFLAFCMLCFELTALYFQYGLDLAPCVMCVYERVAMMGILVSALVAAIAPRFFIFRWVGLIGWGYASYEGLMLSIEHVGYQFNTSGGLGATCSIFTNFPTWLPLNEWVPWMFNPTGDCSKIVWKFLDLYSMPQCLIAIFSAILFVMVVVMFSQFYNSHREKY